MEYQRVNDFFSDYTQNISQGGAFIRTNTPLDVGTEMVFQLQVPNLQQPLAIRGEVRWVRHPRVVDDDDDPDPEEEPGMGVRFLYDNAEQQREVASLVEQLMRQTLAKEDAEQLIGALAKSGDK